MVQKRRYNHFPFLLVVFLIVFFLTLPLLSAHEETETGFQETETPETAIPNNQDHGLSLKQQALAVTSGVGMLVLILTVTALRYAGRMSEKQKKFFFLSILIPVVLTTLYAAGTTIYLNQISHTSGPVHWHADFEIWNCGKEIDLRDPTGLSNRIGSPVFHEHGDNRIHVEGVVLKAEDVSLHRFFEFVGGKLTGEKMLVPTNSGFIQAENGQDCAGQPGKVQVFIYKTQQGTYRQQKLENYEEYVLSPHSQVPPGDCIIIEFDQEKETTDLLCDSYQSAVGRGDAHGP